MKKIYIYLITALIGMSLMSCEENNQEPLPPAPEKEEPFKVEVSVDEVKGDEVTVSFTANDDEATYYVSVITKESHHSNDGDAFIVERDECLFETFAEQAGKTKEEYISGVLKKGTFTEKFTQLAPATDYYAYAYALDSDGNAGIKIFKAEFSTEERDYSKYSIRFENIQTEKEQYSITAIPEDSETPYFYTFIDEATFNAIGGEDGNKMYIQEFFKIFQERYEMDMDEIVSILTNPGEQTFVHTGLLPKSKYYSLAALVEDDGTAKSEVSGITVETQPIDYLDSQYEFELQDIGFNTAKIKITPSDEKQYLSAVIEKELAETFLSDEQLMMGIIESYGTYMPWYTYSGEATMLVEELEPETEYVITAFGVDTKTYMYTTHLFKSEFTTTEETAPDDLSFTITADEISAYTASITYTPSVTGIFYVYDAISKEDYDEYGGSDNGIQDYFSEVIDQIIAQFPDMTKAQIIEALGSTSETVYYNKYLEAETEYYAWAVACNQDGKFISDIFKTEFTTKQFVRGDVSVKVEGGEYYDGEELADLDPVKFSEIADKAVMPITLEPSDNAIHWYISAYQGDLTSDDIYDDELIRDMLINGNEDKNETIFALPWDTELTICAVAVSSEGEFGEITKQVMTLTKDGASPSEDFPYLSARTFSRILFHDGYSSEKILPGNTSMQTARNPEKTERIKCIRM